MLRFLCINTEICLVTLVAVVTSVAWVTNAGARDAQAVPPALSIHTLAAGHVAFDPLPSAVALAAPPIVLTVAAAQNWARR